MTHAAPPETETLETIDEVAALWFMRQHSQNMSAEQSQQFVHWLQESPEHAKAYEAIAGVWRDFDLMPKPQLNTSSQKKRFFFRLWRPLGNTLAAFSIVALLVLPYSHLPLMLFNNMTLAATNMPKEVTLSDGSKLFLNHHTRIRVAYKTDVRQVYLDEGSAYFKVAPNPYRPFIIQADQRKIQVVGTEFEVEKDQQQIAVQVSQGIVSFQSGNEQKINYLFAGDSAVSHAVNGKVILNKISPLDVARWRFGELSFTDKPLGDVLKELKNYSSAQIELSPPSLSQRKISGRINLQQPDQFFQALPMLLPVEVIYHDKNNILIINNKKNK
ncbi:FecR family protein [Providencia sneebia]|uniref:FecR-like transcriptional regulator n=1 Tax=Providencia sneebia DSM 19967 TaxID=1141660 RepID=K8WBJ6_9GAMM|nr:FecR-like transcriptional regulator [Providencia sneebia DSM 19967]